MKVFKVNLYRIHYPTGMMMSVSPVIVQKKTFSVKEILTGYSKINLVPKTAVYEGKPVPRLDRRFWNPKKKISQGEHLVVIQEDLCAQNQVNAEDIDAYVEEYESSKESRTCLSDWNI